VTQRAETARAETNTLIPSSAFVGGAVAFIAVTLEVWGSWGTGADVAPPRSWFVASGWPVALRVSWWLVAAVGVHLANRGLARATGRSRRVITGVTVVPFVAFAFGIAIGAEWATWH
jgi:hypothetical protein